jgi:ABC-2 type transport system ATP-binding protein
VAQNVTGSIPSPLSNGPAITTSGLTKMYDSWFRGGVKAVDNLSITVERGEIFGFLGPNGAGKTTTMRILLGLLAPTDGSATMLGMDVGSQLPAILARTGSIIENPTFYPFLSGRENLQLVQKLNQGQVDRVEEMLALVDLTGDATRNFKKYSLGMKQRLAVAASLLADPDLLILDEPANGLDPAGIVDMRNLMKRLKDAGKTVFISSHVLAEIEQICDRVAILDRGRVVVQGKMADLLGGDNQVEIAIGEVERAADILRRLDWVDAVAAQDGVLVVTAPSARSWELNKALAESGLYAAQIKPREATLEQYFLDVTRGADA